jgi:hypothetical protein
MLFLLLDILNFLASINHRISFDSQTEHENKHSHVTTTGAWAESASGDTSLHSLVEVIRWGAWADSASGDTSLHSLVEVIR